MSINDYLKIQRTIQISRDVSDEIWYISKIQNVDKKYFYVDIPYQKATPLILNKGEQVKVQMFLPSERIGFKSTVTGMHVDNIPLFILLKPEQYNRIQQRRFVRIPVMMDAFYAEVPIEADKTPRFVKTNTLDLSAGGLRIKVDKEYPSGTILLLKFTLQAVRMEHEITVAGKVARTFKVDQAGTIHAAMEFTEITSRQQDLIMNFIMNKMSSARRMS